MARPSLQVHLSPRLVEPGDLAGGFVIVIDLLRASTTIVHALAAGAAAVIPCEEIDEARRRAAAIPGALLGGERAGVRIEGFDLGNSPREYTAERVAGRTIVFTTTNGTRAIRRAASAERVVVGCFANLSRTMEVANTSHRRDKVVHLLCAGINGQICDEDAMCAGAFAAGLAQEWGTPVSEESVTLAVDAWSKAQAHPGGLAGALRDTWGGRNLVGAGLAEDIPVCAAIDACATVPGLDPVTGAIVHGASTG